MAEGFGKLGYLLRDKLYFINDEKDLSSCVPAGI